jgi:FAST kinase-like protein, subdomain 1
MNWYNQKLELNSRLIREICQSLQIANFSHDSVCDQLFEYIVENQANVSGETVEKVLTACYSLSYFPENLEVLECCSQIVERDFAIMNGLAVVKALLALTFYKTCPYDLCTRVFHSDFIKRLEQEIEMAYSKDVYPQRVLQLVMQLNRALCLDNPEYNIRQVFF